MALALATKVPQSSGVSPVRASGAGGLSLVRSEMLLMRRTALVVLLTALSACTASSMDGPNLLGDNDDQSGGSGASGGTGGSGGTSKGGSSGGGRAGAT